MTESPYFFGRLHLAVSIQAGGLSRMRPRRTLAGGLALAVTSVFSVAQRHVGKRRRDTSLRRYGLAALVLIGATLQAADPTAAQQADKRAETFFRPTPGTLLRVVSTDGPAVTENPVTVHAGQVRCFAGISRRF